MTDPNVLAKQEADTQFAVAVEWRALIENFTIATDEQQEQVMGLLREVKGKFKALEARRTEITGPLNAALRSVNDLFRPPKEKFEDLERLLKAKVAKYLELKRQANATYAQLGAQAATPEQATQILQQMVPVEPPRGVSVRSVWKFNVTDPDAVPRELCSPDVKKIGAACQYAPDGQPLPIPGVQWFQDSSVTVRQ